MGLFFRSQSPGRGSSSAFARRPSVPQGGDPCGLKGPITKITTDSFVTLNQPLFPKWLICAARARVANQAHIKMFVHSVSRLSVTQPQLLDHIQFMSGKTRHFKSCFFHLLTTNIFFIVENDVFPYKITTSSSYSETSLWS